MKNSSKSYVGCFEGDFYVNHPASDTYTALVPDGKVWQLSDSQEDDYVCTLAELQQALTEYMKNKPSP